MRLRGHAATCLGPKLGFAKWSHGNPRASQRRNKGNMDHLDKRQPQSMAIAKANMTRSSPPTNQPTNQNKIAFVNEASSTSTCEPALQTPEHRRPWLSIITRSSKNRQKPTTGPTWLHPLVLLLLLERKCRSTHFVHVGVVLLFVLLSYPSLSHRWIDIRRFAEDSSVMADAVTSHYLQHDC